MGRILAKYWLAARDPRYLADWDSSDLVRGEIGRRRTLLCSDLRRLRHEACQDSARQNAGSQSERSHPSSSCSMSFRLRHLILGACRSRQRRRPRTSANEESLVRARGRRAPPGSNHNEKPVKNVMADEKLITIAVFGKFLDRETAPLAKRTDPREFFDDSHGLITQKQANFSNLRQACLRQGTMLARNNPFGFGSWRPSLSNYEITDCRDRCRNCLNRRSSGGVFAAGETSRHRAPRRRAL
jgi:hypothetical protein